MLSQAGLKITAGHRTMSGQDDYLSGQNLGLAVILTGHVRISRKKNYLLLSEKYKTVKSSQQLVVTNSTRIFHFFSNTEKKISIFENIRIRVDRVYNQNRIQRKS